MKQYARRGVHTGTRVLARRAPRLALPALLWLAHLLLLSAAPAVADELDIQRATYRAAQQAAAISDWAEFFRLRDELHDYPLYPYLEFETVGSARYPEAREAIDRFLADQGDMPLANRLRTRLLREFYAQHDWRNFLAYYRDSVHTLEFECQYQEARYHTGDRREAVRAGLTLWNVGHSQPEGCDNLFALLTHSGEITEAIAWQRYAKAVLANQIGLAHHLEHFFVLASVRSRAARYLQLYQNPRLLSNHTLLPDHSPEVVALIAQTLERAARTDAAQALEHWQYYQRNPAFDVATRSRVQTAIVRALYDQGYASEMAEQIQRHGDLLDSGFHEWYLRRHIAAGDWRALVTGIDQLPASLQTEPRWRYWRARALQLLGESDPGTAATTFAELATQRSFYGFLACDWLDQSYTMAQSEEKPDEAVIAALAARPALRRVRELLYHGQELDAAREWWRATRNLAETEWLAAGHLAHRWEWHYQAILAMVKASRWDEIDARFPVLHRQPFETQSERQGLPVQLMLALARQESAFRAEALSPAGARGLMQLMPATANEVARAHDIPYRTENQLYDPEVNIALGTSYYRDMLDRFQDNRILATAAYNAGPGRVRGWLTASGGRLPFDAWIEAIPFVETRNYVQNVLTFSAIYAHRLGTAEQILSPQERLQPL
ncbi:MAG: transglycosylase SLT domain-containing protein [Gammaproteobacteria bacterium]|nr:transglycosylase SLT domain-containing protein [Gammaproteobacteria bacterium]